jgi:Ca2+-binding RTX toxin-like protein
MWMMNGGQLVQDVAVPGPIPVGWNILNGHADYNGDGKSDILWRGPEGQVSVWLMNGPSIAQGNALGTIPLDWSIVDSQGDYNGDGKSDILWRGPQGQTSMWLMDGSNIALGQFLPGPIPPDWTIADGHGDYNGDGKSDLLWRGPQGETSVWLMDGNNIAQGGVLLAPPLFWKIVDGHGDYNGDGKSDVLWRGPDGQTVLWQINGTQLTQSSGLPGPIPADWSVTGESGATLVGDASANTLFGTDAADTLRGGAGADTLRGNGAGDRFVFDAPLNAATNVDAVQDFNPGEDKLTLSEVIFTQLPVGALSAASFVSGANPVAQDANDFVLYNTSNGQVSYDADGNGPGAAVAFATLFGSPKLDANDVDIHSV